MKYFIADTVPLNLAPFLESNGIDLNFKNDNK